MSTGRFKLMRDRTDAEVEEGIAVAIAHCKSFKNAAGESLDFYTILTGIDSYFEKRTRKESKVNRI